MTSDLVAFLNARLEEAHMHATKDLWLAQRASGSGRWEAHYGYNLPYSELRAGDEVIGRMTMMRPWPGGRPDGAEDQHQADVSLAARMCSAAKPRAERMLREVEADRKLLAAFEMVERECATMLGDRRPRKYGEYDGLLLAVKIRAERFADHPDYDPAWAAGA